MVSGFSGLLPRKAGIPNFRKSLLTVTGLTSQLVGAMTLRFGQPRVMALFVALSLFQHLIDGLRRKGLIYRPPRSRRYFLTPWGWKVARLFARLEARVFRPAVAAFGEEPSALPRPLRAALKKVDAELDQLVSAVLPLRKAA